MTDTADWAQPILDAQTIRTQAALAEEQAIRDAIHAGASPYAVAKILNVPVGDVFAALGRSPEGVTPQQPASPVVVYLRGAGRGDDTWQRVQTAMHARGWDTIRDRTQAWHLARSSYTTVVMCDFSTDLDDTPGPHYGYDRYVLVGRVRARYESTRTTGEVGSLLETADAVRYIREDWTSLPVTIVTQEMDLAMKRPIKLAEPTRWDPDARNAAGHQGVHVLDEQVLAGLVAQVLHR